MTVAISHSSKQVEPKKREDSFYIGDAVELVSSHAINERRKATPKNFEKKKGKISKFVDAGITTGM